MRLTRRHRLRDREAFQTVFRTGKRISSPAFQVVVGKPRKAYPARLGLSISKRQVRRAVDRNRLKRLIRESFRQHRERMEGRDIIVVARFPAVGLDNATIRKKFSAYWKNI